MRPFYERRIERIVYIPEARKMSEHVELIDLHGYAVYRYVTYSSGVIYASVVCQLRDVARIRFGDLTEGALLELKARSEHLRSGMTRIWLEWSARYSGTYTLSDAVRDSGYEE